MRWFFVCSAFRAPKTNSEHGLPLGVIISLDGEIITNT
ncbi:hypothetical protein SMIM3I_02231 [Streptococcus mitis]|uniref:Uncharacterized protein n=1 Tax=Streptococcus mitis TaxID=28037 RepID=A0A150NLJ9_STRMT|nr:hypothetical protein SMIM3I_02231 [Streptococcus mitis]